MESSGSCLAWGVRLVGQERLPSDEAIRVYLSLTSDTGEGSLTRAHAGHVGCTCMMLERFKQAIFKEALDQYSRGHLALL